MKNKYKIAVFKTLSVLVCSAFLSALSIVFGKYLAIPVGSILRFSFENTPIMLGGMLFGPIIGSVIGTVADLVGCIMVGYEINPLVTLGAASIGLISGGVFNILKNRTPIQTHFNIIISVFSAHIIGSVILKTAGLSAYYDIHFALLMLWRLLNYIIVGICDGLIIALLMKSRLFMGEVNKILRKK